MRAFGRKVLVTGVGLALLTSLLALVASYFMVKPLRKLTEGARRVGTGDMEVHVNVKSKDEFGELGRNVDELTHRLRGMLRNIAGSSVQLAAAAEETAAPAAKPAKKAAPKKAAKADEKPAKETKAKAEKAAKPAAKKEAAPKADKAEKKPAAKKAPAKK